MLINVQPLLLASSLLLGASTAVAQETVPFKVGGANPTASVERATPVGGANCNFLDKKLPKDTIVVAAGGYSGRNLPFQIDQSNHQATQFDVAVHADKPVALLLAAYEPTVWSIGWTKGTKIVAVYATGYYRQGVAGLPKGVPIITSSFSEKSACGYAYMGESLDWVNPKSRAVFGKDATRIYNKANGGVLDIVESTSAKAEYVTTEFVKPESFRDQTAPLAGAAGLADAVAKGLIRPITPADIDTVRKHYQARAASTPSGKADIPPVAGVDPSAGPTVRVPPLSGGYVVLKPFVYPAGLYGGHLSSFIIPKGTPAPSGNAGHSTVVDLNRAEPCIGPICR